MWTLEDGLRVVRALQPLTREYNYHLTLGGGVLNKGQSQKDLDLFFLPMMGFSETATRDADGMLAYLKRLWGPAEPLASGQDLEDPTALTRFYKHAVKFTRRGGDDGSVQQRIDCFIF
jgi:hypothetical protein